MTRFTAFLDACVLVPIAPCDTLLRMADCGAFRPLWSEQVDLGGSEFHGGHCITLSLSRRSRATLDGMPGDQRPTWVPRRGGGHLAAR